MTPELETQRPLDAVIAAGAALVPRRALAAGRDVIVGHVAVGIGRADHAQVVLPGRDCRAFRPHHMLPERPRRRIVRLAAP